MELRTILFGYNKHQFEYSVNAEEAKIVKYIFEEYISGRTLLQIGSYDSDSMPDSVFLSGYDDGKCVGLAVWIRKSIVTRRRRASPIIFFVVRRMDNRTTRQRACFFPNRVI